MKTRFTSVRASAVTAAIVMTFAIAIPAAIAVPSPDTLANAVAAAEHGQSTARDLAKGPKDESKTTGLDRAAEALAKVAEKRAEKQAEKAGEEKPGNGFGRGHAAEVHAVLAAGGSPSELAPHGESVSELAKAYQQVKGDDHPGKGHGKGGNPEDNDDVDDDH